VPRVAEIGGNRDAALDAVDEFKLTQGKLARDRHRVESDSRPYSNVNFASRTNLLNPAISLLR
jgi:hypothetical protein